jgi:hypothetical protein
MTWAMSAPVVVAVLWLLVILNCSSGIEKGLWCKVNQVKLCWKRRYELSPDPIIGSTEAMLQRFIVKSHLDQGK